MDKTTVFTSNRTQAVRLPAHLRLPGDVRHVHVRAVGRERIITPVDHTWDSFFQVTPPASDDFMEAGRASQEQPARESL